jgi:AraC-like DNA-binding protein
MTDREYCPFVSLSREVTSQMPTTEILLCAARAEAKEFDGPLIPVPMHSHEEFEFSCCEAGAGRYRFTGCSYTVPRGTLVAVQASEIHGFDPLLHPPIGSIYRALYISPRAIQDLPVAGRARARLVLENPIVRYSQLRDEFLSAHRALFESDSELERQAITDAFLLLIVQRQAREAVPLCLAGKEKTWVRKIREYLEDHAPRTILAQELMELTGLNRMYLTRVFSEEVGIPPHVYLMQLRLHQARDMLRKREAITEAAFATGFTDQAHFSRNFKKYFGCTPGDYQSTLRRPKGLVNI